MKNVAPMNYAMIGAAVLIVASVAIIGRSVLAKDAPGTSGTEPWPQEALSIVVSIEQSGDQWQNSQDNLAIGQKIINEAQNAMTRAEAAAKGADLTLCAKFQARYDRTNKILVADAACPLN